MFSNFGTRLAMKKMGISSDALNFSSPKKNQKDVPPGANSSFDDDENGSNWPKWMTVKSLPLTVQPWLSPPPPPVPVATECPKVGDLAPIDRDGKLALGKRRKVVVVFLRCAGCAFAHKTFLALRTLANKHQFNNLTCIAISHSSAAATQKWIDILGGAWNVEVIIDEDRAIYAAWGLGLSSVWYYFNPTTQTAAWKEKGWLGSTVATSIGKRMGGGTNLSGGEVEGPGGGGGGSDGPTTVMGNKWQQGGAFAVDERGAVVWGGKARSADDVMDLEAGSKALGL